MPQLSRSEDPARAVRLLSTNSGYYIQVPAAASPANGLLEPKPPTGIVPVATYVRGVALTSLITRANKIMGSSMKYRTRVRNSNINFTSTAKINDNHRGCPSLVRCVVLTSRACGVPSGTRAGGVLSGTRSGGVPSEME